MNWNIDFAQGLACDRSIGCQVNHFRKGLEPYNHNNLLTLDLSMNVLPPLVCKFHQGQCLPFPIDIKPIPATSLPAQAAQARLAQLQANMGGLQGLAVGPQLGGLPNINFHFSCAVYIRLISPKQVVALRSRFDSTTSCGGIHARFCRGGLQDENVKLPHGVSTTSLGTSLQPGGSKETLPSPPATPAANTTAYTPPTSVVKALDAFHVTSPQQAAPPNDSVSVTTENDSAENVEPILPDNQLGLSPSQLPGSPEPVPPKERVPSDPPPPIQGPPPEAPKGQGSSQDLRVSGAVPREGSGEGPEKEGKKTADKNKYKDGTYWKSCTQRLKAMNQYIVNVLVYTVLTVFIWGFGTMWNQIGKGRWRQVKTSSSCSKHQRAATCPIWSWWLHIDRHTLCKLCAHIYVYICMMPVLRRSTTGPIVEAWHFWGCWGGGCETTEGRGNTQTRRRMG